MSIMDLYNQRLEEDQEKAKLNQSDMHIMDRAERLESLLSKTVEFLVKSEQEQDKLSVERIEFLEDKCDKLKKEIGFTDKELESLGIVSLLKDKFKMIAKADYPDYFGEFSDFDYPRQEEIFKGIKAGIDVSWYAKPEFDWQQMLVVREGLQNGQDVSVYAKPEFNDYQMREIRQGLSEGLDVSIYAKPEFTYNQMKEIHNGLAIKLDVSKYANPQYSAEKMSLIKDGLKKKLDVSMYTDPRFNEDQMREIKNGLEDGVDVRKFARPYISADDMYSKRIKMDPVYVTLPDPYCSIQNMNDYGYINDDMLPMSANVAKQLLCDPECPRLYALHSDNTDMELRLFDPELKSTKDLIYLMEEANIGMLGVTKSDWSRYQMTDPDKIKTPRGDFKILPGASWDSMVDKNFGTWFDCENYSIMSDGERAFAVDRFSKMTKKRADFTAKTQDRGIEEKKHKLIKH